ncbi:hypothetical protein [Sphingobium sp. LB126]|uniref:hypothetical protein n=1 Tax=Sphingobium sp. LB126 TaxID=1983755 RepID=UPI0018D546CD|nr:hypothetical protein [Sphingobium sp. LB126]
MAHAARGAGRAGGRCRPEIWFLSARYGFHPADMRIADYEQRMTPSRAAELLRLPTSNHAAFAEAARGADRILLAGGAIYRDAMRRAIGQHPSIAETDGGGIGIHRQQLRRWLAVDRDTTGAVPVQSLDAFARERGLVTMAEARAISTPGCVQRRRPRLSADGMRAKRAAC